MPVRMFARSVLVSFALFFALSIYISDGSSEQFSVGPKKIRICTLNDC